MKCQNGLLCGENQKTHVITLAMKASMWKIFLDPIRILSSCK